MMEGFVSIPLTNGSGAGSVRAKKYRSYGYQSGTLVAGKNA